MGEPCTEYERATDHDIEGVDIPCFWCGVVESKHPHPHAPDAQQAARHDFDGLDLQVYSLVRTLESEIKDMDATAARRHEALEDELVARIKAALTAAHAEHAKLREENEALMRQNASMVEQDATEGLAYASLLAAAKEAREAAGAILHEWDRQGFGPNGTLEWHHIYQLRAAHAALAKAIPS